MPTPQSKHAFGRIITPRPPLPLQNVNPNLITMDPLRPPPVKFQEIVREGLATIVGRVKIATPNGHAFILRRLDTGAISLTTMFRASFPTATDDAEKAESSWVKANFDLSGTNKSGKSRFAGTWVTPETAKSLASAYHLGPIIDSLAEASPDPNFVYRKSTRAQQQQQPTPTASPTPVLVAGAITAVTAHAHTTTHPANQQTTPTQPAAKRRREESPSEFPVRSTPPPAYRSQASIDPSSFATITSPAPSSVSNAAAVAAATSPPAPRRSARLKSPVPTPLTPKTPRAARASAREKRETPPSTGGSVVATAMTPAGSDETAVEHEHEDESEAAKVTEVNMEDDVREQKALIERLKAERAAKQQQKEQEKTEEDEEMEGGDEDSEVGQKRAREEGKEEYRLNIKEPETEERQIVTNKRVRGGLLGNMRPERKSLAWGALLFAAGMSAVTFIPSLPGFF